MPGQLGWNQLSAPDLSTALAGVQGAGTDFNRASSTLADALGTFRQQQQDQNSKALLMNLQRYQDPASLQAALQNGSAFAGFNPGDVNAGVIQDAGRQVGNLLTNATNAETLRQNQWVDNRTQDSAARLDAATPAINKAQALAQAGKYEEANQIMASDPTIQALRPEQFSQVGTNNLNSGQSSSTLLNAAADRADDRLAQGEGLKLAGTQGSLADVDNALATDPAYANYTGHQKMLIRQYAAAAGGWAGGAPGGPGGGGMPGAPGSSDAAGGVGAAGSAPGAGNADQTALQGALGKIYGGGSLPDSVKTVGDFVNYYPTMKDGSGTIHSPLGVYQITGDTWKQFAPQALGKDWQNANLRDFNTQDAVGKAVFQDALSKADPVKALMGRWASLTQPEAQALVKSGDWNKARETIAQGESSVSPLQLMSQQSILDQARINQAQQTAANSLFGAVQKTAGDQTDINTVATKLQKDSYSGVDQGTIATRLKSIIDKGAELGYNVSPALAAEILNKNATGQNVGARVFSTVGLNANNLGNGREMNWNGVVSDLKDLSTGKVQDSATAFQGIQNNHIATGVAYQNYQNALNKYLAAQEEARTKKNFSPSTLQDYSDAVDRAKMNWLTAQHTEAQGIPKDAFPASLTNGSTPAAGILKGKTPPPGVTLAAPTNWNPVNMGMTGSF